SLCGLDAERRRRAPASRCNRCKVRRTSPPVPLSTLWRGGRHLTFGPLAAVASSLMSNRSASHVLRVDPICPDRTQIPVPGAAPRSPIYHSPHPLQERRHESLDHSRLGRSHWLRGLLREVRREPLHQCQG